MLTPQFLNVGSDVAVPLQSIKPTGDDVSDNVNIQTLDRAGRTVDSYLWINWAGDNSDQEAWVNDETYEIIEDVSFDAGAGLWVTGSASTQGIQSAGQVGKNDVTIQLRVGATGTGNPFPTSVNLQDIIASGDEVSDNVNIQTLDRAGRTVDSYLWINWAGDNSDQEAWVNDETYEIVTGVTFGPGEGLWISGSSNSQYVTFPAPEL